MATNFSPCKGSYVLNQFPSNVHVMFGMNGFHVSASGAIQGHHGPLVLPNLAGIFLGELLYKLFTGFTHRMAMKWIFFLGGGFFKKSGMPGQVLKNLTGMFLWWLSN